MDRIRDYIHQGELEAPHASVSAPTPSGRLIARGIRPYRPPHERCPRGYRKYRAIWRSHRSARRLPWLATTAAGAPMIRLPRTVIGMVEAFYNLASAGSSANIGILAGGYL